MKHIITLSLIFASLIGFGQGISNTILDSGYKVLRINKKFEDVKQYLVKADKKDMLDTNISRRVGTQFTSCWTVNLKKAGMQTFFGLKVARIEVYMNGEYDEKKNVVDHDIYAFTIYCEKPSNEKDEEDFRLRLFNYYGSAEIMFSKSEKVLVHNTWFRTITMFTMIYGVDFFTDKNLKYYEAHFEQGYGG